MRAIVGDSTRYEIMINSPDTSEGHPEGANMPFMPDAPQEFSSGLDTDLRKLAQQIRV
jgi:hypothetical protein